MQAELCIFVKGKLWQRWTPEVEGNKVVKTTISRYFCFDKELFPLKAR